jgi:predicted NUDIX family NTP pyrophosphohydrolase
MRILLATVNAPKGDLDGNLAGRLVVDHAGRALLFRYADARAVGTWWGPPGGELAPGEDHLAAVRRELLEELARDDLRLGPWDPGCDAASARSRTARAQPLEAADRVAVRSSPATWSWSPGPASPPGSAAAA